MGVCIRTSLIPTPLPGLMTCRGSPRGSDAVLKHLTADDIQSDAQEEEWDIPSEGKKQQDETAFPPDTRFPLDAGPLV